MNYFDFTVLGVVAFSGLFSFYRGILKEIASIVKWVAATFTAFYYYDKFSHYFINIVLGSEKLANVFSAITLFLLVLIFFTTIIHIISFPLSTGPFKFIDKSLGLLFGVVKMILILSLTHFLLFRFYEKWPLLVKQAQVTPHIGKIGYELGNLIVKNMKLKTYENYKLIQENGFNLIDKDNKK